MHHVFSTSSQQEQEAGDVKLGDSSTQNGTNAMVAEIFQTSKQVDSNLRNFSPGSPLSSSFCKIQNQRSSAALTK